MKKGWQAERWRKLIWFPDRSETEVRADRRDTKEKKWFHFFPSSRCRSPCFCNTDLKSQAAAFMNSSKPSEVWNLGHSEAASPPFQNHFAHFYEAAACLFCWCASDLRLWTGEGGVPPLSLRNNQFSALHPAGRTACSQRPSSHQVDSFSLLLNEIRRMILHLLRSF